MIWGRTKQQAHDRLRALNQWQPWFAWHPVQLDDGRWAWLRTVERRGQYLHGGWEVYWEWEYRP